ncbi:restriction endonuclease [Escherichia coli O8:H10]
MFTPISKVADWKDLQEKVCGFFEELGYEAKTNHSVTLATGGKAEVDVFATKGNSPLAQKILFECKHWNTSVPRAIVQSFKMDVQEAGANFGIIVAKQGFQSGSYEGVTLTTVKLYTFEELQEVFAKEWAEQVLRPVMERQAVVADLARNFEFGTPERSFFESTLFNEKLKALYDDLWASIYFPLALYKDYFVRDALSQISPVNVTFPTQRHDGQPRTAQFEDVRTMAACFRNLFDHAIKRWKDYQNMFALEFGLATEREQRDIFGLPSK